MFISQDLVDALINIGYEMYIFDKDGYYPRGLSREQWEAEETAKAITASQQTVQDGQADTEPECDCNNPEWPVGKCLNCGGLPPAA